MSTKPSARWCLQHFKTSLICKVRFSISVSVIWCFVSLDLLQVPPLQRESGDILTAENFLIKFDVVIQELHVILSVSYHNLHTRESFTLKLIINLLGVINRT